MKNDAEKIKESIEVKTENIALLVSKGYTINIRPIKGGIKITRHKEKVV